MRQTRTTRATRFFTASLIAAAMTFAAGDALAKTCKNGKCGGGPSNTEIVLKDIESAAPTVESGDLKTAYDTVDSVVDKAEDLNVDGSTRVRDSLRELAGKLEERASAALAEAIDRYFEGDIEDALATFEEIAGFDGLPSAKKAQKELNKEDDRSAWREARDLAGKHITGGDYLAARKPHSEMDRLARRTDYTEQTAAAMKGFSDTLVPVVEATTKLVEQEQYEAAYATLIEISRLSHARQSASEARKMLSKHGQLEGMRQAKGEYEATQELAKVQSWFAEIANPSNKEQAIFKQKLEAIADTYRGTAAAEQAQTLLLKDAQAAR